MKLFIKPFDILIILFAAGIVFFSIYTVYMKKQGQARVLIRGHSSEWSFPLDAQETVVVSGPLGETIVRIHENSAWVEFSPCENQTCTAAGLLFRQGQWAACLPNNVLLLIEGEKDEDVDIVAW
jgi:hypothetical protein